MPSGAEAEFLRKIGFVLGFFVGWCDFWGGWGVLKHNNKGKGGGHYRATHQVVAISLIVALLVGPYSFGMMVPPPYMYQPGLHPTANTPVEPQAQCIAEIIKQTLRQHFREGNYSIWIRLRAKSIRRKVEEALRTKCPTPDSCTHEEVIVAVQEHILALATTTNSSISRTRRALFRVAIATLIIASINWGLTSVLPPIVAASVSTFVGVIIAAPVNAVMSAMMEPLASWIRKRSFNGDIMDNADLKGIPDIQAPAFEETFFRSNRRLQSTFAASRGASVDTNMMTNGFLTTALPMLERLLDRTKENAGRLTRKQMLEFIASDIAAAAIMIRALYTELPEVDKSIALNVGMRLRPRLAVLPNRDREALQSEIWSQISGDKARSIPAHDPTIEPKDLETDTPVRDYYGRLLDSWFGETVTNFGIDTEEPLETTPEGTELTDVSQDEAA